MYTIFSEFFRKIFSSSALIALYVLGGVAVITSLFAVGSGYFKVVNLNHASDSLLIRGVVANVSSYKGSAVFTLKSDNREFVVTVYPNEKYYPNDLGPFLKAGDSISKERLADSVYVFRGEKKYVWEVFYPDPE